MLNSCKANYQIGIPYGFRMMRMGMVGRGSRTIMVARDHLMEKFSLFTLWFPFWSKGNL